jgi:diguanylate cyclase (GGDEF)-like protein
LGIPVFPFAEPFGDARLEELKLLAWTAEHGGLAFPEVPSGPWHDLLVSLVWSELLTVFSFEDAKSIYAAQGVVELAPPLYHPDDAPLVRAMASIRIRAVCDLFEMAPPAGLRITHLGRVRLSELKQALRSGREREPFGILWDVRHWEQDLQITILESREAAPLALAYMDMNGLKQINDTWGHDAGDAALKTYLQSVALALGDRGQGYRLGGDEVLVVLPNHDRQAGLRVLELACKKLMSERVDKIGARPFASIAAGLVVNTDSTVAPVALRSAADQVQYRAKQRSKEGTPRPSVIAVKGEDDMIVLEHECEAK